MAVTQPRCQKHAIANVSVRLCAALLALIFSAGSQIFANLAVTTLIAASLDAIVVILSAAIVVIIFLDASGLGMRGSAVGLLLDPCVSRLRVLHADPPAFCQVPSDPVVLLRMLDIHNLKHLTPLEFAKDLTSAPDIGGNPNARLNRAVFTRQELTRPRCNKISR